MVTFNEESSVTKKRKKNPYLFQFTRCCVVQRNDEYISYENVIEGVQVCA